MTSQPKTSGILWLAVVALVILAFAGGGLLVYALLNSREPAPPPISTLLPTQVAVQPSHAVVVIPTVTAPPPAASTTTAVLTDTPAPVATDAPSPASTDVPTSASGPVLDISKSANIRSGPGFNYPVIGGLEAGKTAPLIGRDASAQWYVITYAASAKGQGWVSSLVSAYSGDVNSLPVIAAPPPPPPTAVPPTAVATTAPPPAAPPVQSKHGIVGDLRLCDSRTTYAAGERICIIEKIFNSSSNAVDYGILGVKAAPISGGQDWFQSSWTGYGYAGGVLTINSNCTGPVGHCDGEWKDFFPLSAGTYQFFLSICYSSVTTCQGGGEWETLTSPITIVVQ